VTAWNEQSRKVPYPKMGNWKFLSRPEQYQSLTEEV
jgi:hypothetical protein